MEEELRRPHAAMYWTQNPSDDTLPNSRQPSVCSTTDTRTTLEPDMALPEQGIAQVDHASPLVPASTTNEKPREAVRTKSAPASMASTASVGDDTDDLSPIARMDNLEAGPTPKTPEWKPTRHELLIMFVLSTISLMVALDACIIVTSLSAIVVDLGATTTQGFWIGTSYLLTNAVTMPFTAALSDIFGRNTLLVASLLFFTFGTLLCCFAHSIALLLVGRSLQGVGGGGVVILSLVIFTDIVPLRFRPKWYGTVLGAWALGNCLGPVLGGLIAEHTTWRWVFYIMLPFCAFGLVSVPLLLTLNPRTATIGQKLARVDWVGAGLFTASATAFLVAISWGGTQYAWSSAASLVPLVLGASGLVGTCLYEAYGAREPFLRKSLFGNPSSVATYFCGAIQGLVLYGQLYYGPFYFMAVKGFSPVHTGIALFPVMFTLVPGSIVTGAAVTRWGNYRVAIWLGWLLTAVGSGTMILFDVDTPAAQWAATLVVLGLGHGAILNAQNFATQAMCADGDEGRAAAMYGFARQFGMALGVGVGGSVFQNVMAVKLRAEGLPVAIARNAEAFAWVMQQVESAAGGEVGSGSGSGSGLETTKERVLDAYVYGFRGVYGFFTAVAGLAFLVSLCCVKHRDMNRKIASEHQLKDVRVGGGRVSRMLGKEGGEGKV